MLHHKMLHSEALVVEEGKPRGHAFEPWSGKILHATGQLSLCSRAWEPQLLRPQAAATGAHLPGAHAPEQEKTPR